MIDREKLDEAFEDIEFEEAQAIRGRVLDLIVERTGCSVEVAVVLLVEISQVFRSFVNEETEH